MKTTRPLQIYVRKEEKLDLFFVVFLSFFSIAIIYQITYIQNANPLLREMSRMAMGLGILSFMTVSFILLLSSYGILKIRHLKMNPTLSISLGKIITEDEEFGYDYSRWFLGGLFLQVAFGSVYGLFLGFPFSARVEWELNALLLTLNSAIAEELFFSLFLAGVLLNLVSKKIFVFLAGIGSTLLFVLLHNTVYGTNEHAIIYIMGLRLLYFFVYYKSRRASIPMILHCFNNFLCMGTIFFL
jgi:membrane protease YdiL (CAAX protease family)